MCDSQAETPPTFESKSGQAVLGVSWVSNVIRHPLPFRKGKKRQRRQRCLECDANRGEEIGVLSRDVESSRLVPKTRSTSTTSRLAQRSAFLAGSGSLAVGITRFGLLFPKLTPLREATWC